MDKKNKNPNVPNLRFLQFTDEWSKFAVSELLNTYPTNSLSWDKLSYIEKSKIKNIHYGLIHNGFKSTIINGNDQFIPFINNSFIPKSYTLLQDGDLILADASENRKDVGRPVEMINVDNEKIISGLHTIHARNKTNLLVNGFKGFYFQSYAMKKQIYRIANGSKIYGISPSSFNKLFISVPSKEEQQKIVNLLQKIDDRIETQIKIIDDYSSVKDYIIKQYFQKCKEYINLGNIFKYGKAGGTPKSTIKEFYDGNIPFMGISDITNQGKYISHTSKNITQKGLINSSAWLVPKNSLILSMYASVGLPAINKIPLATSQAMMSMIFDNDLDVEFVYYYLCYFKKSKIQSLLETGTQSNINADTVKSIKVPKLRDDEKERITNIFIKIDQLINNEKEILNSLQKQKNFLLKNMFV